MRNEVVISTLIIGAAVGVALVVAGGPSGFIASSETTTTRVDLWGTPTSGVPTTTRPPTTVAAPSTPREAPPAPPPTTTATSTTVSTSTVPTTVPTTEPTPLRPRAEVLVAVANGALVPGIAGQRAGDLIALGYVDPAAVNTAESAVTVVYAAPGFDAEAARLIDDIGSASTAILAIDAAPSLDPPVEFDLLWVLGTDQRTEG